MGMARAVPLALVLSVCLSACKPAASFHPVHLEKDRAAAPDWLLGEWQPFNPENGKAVGGVKPWSFGEDRIRAHDEEGGASNLFVLYFKVGDQLYADLTAENPDEKTVNAVGMYWLLHMRTIHVLCRITSREGRLVLEYPTAEALCAMADRDGVTLPYLQRSDPVRGGEPAPGTLFTATPKEWRAFLAEHGGEEGLFDGRVEFLRPGKAPAAPRRPAPRNVF
jgi:hypothetical protein